MVKEIIKVLIALGLFCVLMGILFRLYGSVYILPIIHVTPDAALRFANTVFLIAISLGIYELVKKKKDE